MFDAVCVRVNEQTHIHCNQIKTYTMRMQCNPVQCTQIKHDPNDIVWCVLLCHQRYKITSFIWDAWCLNVRPLVGINVNRPAKGETCEDVSQVKERTERERERKRDPETVIFITHEIDT